MNQQTTINWVKASIALPSSDRQVLTCVTTGNRSTGLRCDLVWSPELREWCDFAGDPIGARVYWWAEIPEVPFFYSCEEEMRDQKQVSA